MPRYTSVITSDQARNLLASYDHAQEIGSPLNTHITIHWAGTAQVAARVPERIRKLLERMRHWLERRSVSCYYVWAQEPSKKRLENSDIPHLHLMVHVPHIYRSSFEAMMSEWVGGVLHDNTLKFTDIGSNDWRQRTYLVKGVNPKTKDADLRGIIQEKGRKAKEARGPVEGKRCGVSRNLDRAARARYARSRCIAKQDIKAA